MVQPLSPPHRRRRGERLLHGLVLAALALLLAAPASAAPGLCLGPVCGDDIHRGGQHAWQLRLKVSDQLGHRERITVDCRDGRISPFAGPVERGHVAALARRACRLAGGAAG